MKDDIKLSNKALLDMETPKKLLPPRDTKTGRFSKPSYLRTRIGSNVPFGTRPTQ